MTTNNANEVTIQALAQTEMMVLIQMPGYRRWLRLAAVTPAIRVITGRWYWADDLISTSTIAVEFVGF